MVRDYMRVVARRGFNAHNYMSRALTRQARASPNKARAYLRKFWKSYNLDYWQTMLGSDDENLPARAALTLVNNAFRSEEGTITLWITWKMAAPEARFYRPNSDVVPEDQPNYFMSLFRTYREINLNDS